MPRQSISENPPSLAAPLKRAIRDVIWFEPPEEVIRNPVRLLCYAMQYTSEPSFTVLRQHFGDDAFRDALRNAPPGILDQKSWGYFHDYFRPYGAQPVPSLPQRKFRE